MHAIHKPTSILTIGEHFFLDKPIHKQIAKFYCTIFERKVYDTIFFPKSMHWNLKTPRNNSGREPLHESFKSRQLKVNGKHSDSKCFIHFNTERYFVYAVEILLHYVFTSHCICTQVFICQVINYWMQDQCGYYCSSKTSVELARCYHELCLTMVVVYAKHWNLWMPHHKMWSYMTELCGF
jgi:hypothetical protein